MSSKHFWLHKVQSQFETVLTPATAVEIQGSVGDLIKQMVPEDVYQRWLSGKLEGIKPEEINSKFARQRDKKTKKTFTTAEFQVDRAFGNWNQFIKKSKETLEKEVELLENINVGAGRQLWIDSDDRCRLLFDLLKSFDSVFFLNAVKHLVENGLISWHSDKVGIHPSTQKYAEALQQVAVAQKELLEKKHFTEEYFTLTAQAVILELLNLRSKYSQDWIISEHRLILLLRDKNFEFFLNKLYPETKGIEVDSGTFPQDFKKFVRDLAHTSDYLQKEQALFIKLIQHNLRPILEWFQRGTNFLDDLVTKKTFSSSELQLRKLRKIDTDAVRAFKSKNTDQIGKLIDLAHEKEELIQGSNYPARPQFLHQIGAVPHLQLSSLRDRNLLEGPKLEQSETNIQKLKAVMNFYEAISPGTAEELRIKAFVTVSALSDVSTYLNMFYSRLVKQLQTYIREKYDQELSEEQAISATLDEPYGLQIELRLLSRVINAINPRELKGDKQFTLATYALATLSDYMTNPETRLRLLTDFKFMEYPYHDKLNADFQKVFERNRYQHAFLWARLTEKMSHLFEQLYAYAQSVGRPEVELQSLRENLNRRIYFAPIWSVGELKTMQNWVNQMLKANNLDERATSLDFSDNIFGKIKLYQLLGGKPGLIKPITINGRKIESIRIKLNRLNHPYIFYVDEDPIDSAIEAHLGETNFKKFKDYLVRLREKALKDKWDEYTPDLYIRMLSEPKDLKDSLYVTEHKNGQRSSNAEMIETFLDLPVGIRIFSYENAKPGLNIQTEREKATEERRPINFPLELNSKYYDSIFGQKKLSELAYFIKNYTDKLLDLDLSKIKDVTTGDIDSFWLDFSDKEEVGIQSKQSRDFQHFFTTVVVPTHRFPGKDLLSGDTNKDLVFPEIDSILVLRRNPGLTPEELENGAGIESQIMTDTQKNLMRLKKFKDFDFANYIGSLFTSLFNSLRQPSKPKSQTTTIAPVKQTVPQKKKEEPKKAHVAPTIVSVSLVELPRDPQTYLTRIGIPVSKIYPTGNQSKQTTRLTMPKSIFYPLGPGYFPIDSFDLLFTTEQNAPFEFQVSGHYMGLDIFKITGFPDPAKFLSEQENEIHFKLVVTKKNGHFEARLEFDHLKSSQSLRSLGRIFTGTEKLNALPMHSKTKMRTPDLYNLTEGIDLVLPHPNPVSH